MTELMEACMEIFPSVEDQFSIEEIDGGVNIISRDNGECCATLNYIEDGETVVFDEEYLEWALPLECHGLIPFLVKAMN